MSEILGAIEDLNTQLGNLSERFSTRPETEAVAQLTNQLDALAQRLDNLPTPPEPVDLSGIQAKIKDLNTQLGGLSEQFNARPETTAIQRLDRIIATTLQRLDELSLPTDPVDLSQLEELKTEVHQLVHPFLLTSRLAEEIEELKQGQREVGQIRSIQQQLKDLDVSTAQEHDYTRKLPLGVVTAD